MTFLVEVEMRFNMNGVDAFNIWHVADNLENEPYGLIINDFKTAYWDVLKPQIHDTTTLVSIAAHALDAGAIQPPTLITFNDPGTNPTGDPYFTGLHYWVKLLSEDLGFKSGGKLVGGFGENGIAGQVPALLVTSVLDSALSGLFIALLGNDVPLAIFRPSLSIPGNPAFSLVAATLTEWLSTNNRRSPNIPAP